MPVSSSESTSLTLLMRVQRDDPSAWARLCYLYAPLVYGWCRRAGLQDSDAHDVGQEVFGVVHQRVASFRRESPGESFRGWLRGVTRNKLREHFRDRDRHDRPAGNGASNLMDETPDPRQEPDDAGDSIGEDAAVMRRALDAIRVDFDETTWRAFWRMTIDEQSSADVADELGMTPGGVRQAKFRVLKRLRQELDGLL
jgi:RNA polymerase sigma-70 factor (ECF subfamily)